MWTLGVRQSILKNDHADRDVLITSSPMTDVDFSTQTLFHNPWQDVPLHYRLRFSIPEISLKYLLHCNYLLLCLTCAPVAIVACLFRLQVLLLQLSTL